MDVISIVFATVSAVISILSLVASFFNASKNRSFQKGLERIKADNGKEIAEIKHRYEQEQYKNKVLFDLRTSRCEELTQSMFNNYNNARNDLFPLIEFNYSRLPKEKKEEIVIGIKRKAANDFDNLVTLIEKSRSILPCDVIKELKNFEQDMRELLVWYDCKIDDIIGKSLAPNVTVNDQKMLQDIAKGTYDKFKSIMNMFYELNSVDM